MFYLFKWKKLLEKFKWNFFKIVLVTSLATLLYTHKKISQLKKYKQIPLLLLLENNWKLMMLTIN